MSGARYWYNHSTAETTWVQPDELRQPRSAQAPTGLPISSLLGLSTPPGLPTSSIVGLPLSLPLPPPPAPPPATPPVALPAGWEVHEDDTTGAICLSNPRGPLTTYQIPVYHSPLTTHCAPRTTYHRRRLLLQPDDRRDAVGEAYSVAATCLPPNSQLLTPTPYFLRAHSVACHHRKCHL